MSDFSFSADNDLASYFLGVCQDFKHFGFAVSVIILNEGGDKIVRILRKGRAMSASPRLTASATSLHPLCQQAQHGQFRRGG